MTHLPEHHHHGGCGCYQPAPPCQHGHQAAPHHHSATAPQQRPDRAGQALKWAAAGALGSLFLLAFSMAVIAVAIGAVAVTVCLLVLRSMWREMTGDQAKTKKR